MLWRCCTQYASKFGKLKQWPQDWKRSVFIPVPKKGNAKECSNYRTIALNSHTGKVMLKILQARLQQYMNCELPDVQAGFQKRPRNQRSNCQCPLDHQKSNRVPEKHLSSIFPVKSSSQIYILHCSLLFWNERILLSSEFCKRIVHGTKNIVLLGWSTKGELTQDYV